MLYWQKEITNSLSQLAADTCSQYVDNNKHISDPWVYDLDWSKNSIKLLKKPRKQDSSQVRYDYNSIVYCRPSDLSTKL